MITLTLRAKRTNSKSDDDGDRDDKHDNVYDDKPDEYTIIPGSQLAFLMYKSRFQ